MLAPKQQNCDRALPWLFLAASLVVSLGVWNWAENILVPADTAHDLSKGVPIGNNSDLYPRWLGARELLLHHRDPYSAEVTREIQKGFYGRPLDQSKSSDPHFQQESFVYPLYVVFLLTPTLTMPFHSVQEIFRWLLLIVTGCSLPLWMYAIGFRPKWLLTAAGIVLVMSSYPAILEFHMQNLAALVLFLLAAAAAATVRSWLVLSGFLLALATVKPDISGLFILWLLLWATGEWKDRKALVYSFAGTLAVFVIAAETVSRHWILRFLTAVREYPAYGADPSPLQLILPPFAARLGTVGLLCLLATLCWHWRKGLPGSEDFAWALAWVTAATMVILPKLAGYNQPLLVPALLVLLAQRETIRKAGFVPRAFVKVTFACQIWQWVSAVFLTFCSLLVPAANLYPAAQVPAYPLFSLSILTMASVLVTTLSLRRASHPIRART